MASERRKERERAPTENIRIPPPFGSWQVISFMFRFSFLRQDFTLQPRLVENSLCELVEANASEVQALPARTVYFKFL